MGWLVSCGFTTSSAIFRILLRYLDLKAETVTELSSHIKSLIENKIPEIGVTICHIKHHKCKICNFGKNNFKKAV